MKNDPPSSITVANIDDAPYMDLTPDEDGCCSIPGLGRVKVPPVDAPPTKWLGNEGGDHPAWLYLIEHQPGDKIPRHHHRANRVEVLLKGSIHWRDAEGRDETYHEGTITYVPAGLSYEYEALSATRVLVWFDQRPAYTSDVRL